MADETKKTGTKDAKDLTESEIKATAKAIAAKYKVTEVYVNSRNEFFTQKCNALNSEKEKASIKTFTFK